MKKLLLTIIIKKRIISISFRKKINNECLGFNCSSKKSLIGSLSRYKAREAAKALENLEFDTDTLLRIEKILE